MKAAAVIIMAALVAASAFAGYGSGGAETQLVNENGNDLAVDESTRSQIATTVTRSEINKGNHYYMTGYTTLADGAALRVKLVTPSTDVRCHFTWDITASGILYSTLDEGASGGMTGGSGVTPINSNRNSTNTSAVVLTSGVATCLTYTVRIDNFAMGGTGFKASTGGSSGRDVPVIMKHSCTNLRTFTSGSADNIVSFKASWDEYISLTD